MLRTRGARSTIQDVAGAVYLADNLPEGMEPLLNADHVVATRRTTLPGLTGRRLCVAEVDTEIGTVTIPKYVAVDGCGPVINLAIVDRQLREGLARA